MKIELNTSAIKKHIGKRVKYRHTYYHLRPDQYFIGTIKEIYRKQIDFGNGEWYFIRDLYYIELID